MASLINDYMKIELITNLIDKLFNNSDTNSTNANSTDNISTASKNYNNKTLVNIGVWIFALWCALHALFDYSINIFLKKLRYKEYVRIRLKQSLWYLGFNTIAFCYCLINLQQIQIDSCQQLNLGFLLFIQYYLHCSIWELLNYHNYLAAIKYLCLFILTIFVYFLSFTDVFLRLISLVCFGQIITEFLRCSFIYVKDFDYLKNLLWISGTIGFTLCYMLVIPLYLLKLLVENFNINNIIIVVILVLFLIIEGYNSILVKSILHHYKHRSVDKDTFCYGNIVECSLFPPRNDESYRLQLIRNEIKEREALNMSNRRPKNKSVVYQTLKCMVALKRKLAEKRNNCNANDSDNPTHSKID